MLETKTKKTIFIAGGGFGGVSTAIRLAKLLPKDDARIILANKSVYHTYHPNLYELATSEEEFVSMQALKKSIAIPFAEILPKSVEFIEAEIDTVNTKTNQVNFKQKPGTINSLTPIHYDYLVCALGSTTDYFGIPGLEQYALPLKSVSDALRIRKQVEFVVQQHQMDQRKKFIRIIIGGGGFTGVELAGELVNLADILSWKYSYPREKIELMLIEGSDSLLPGLSPLVSNTIRQRLADSGVSMRFGNFVSSVSDTQVALDNKELVNYDLIIWTGGVRSVPLPFSGQLTLDSKGRLATDDTLRAVGTANIFSIGDCACVLGKNKRPLPPNAQQALFQAEYVAKTIAALVHGAAVVPFRPRESSYIIAAKGKWAALHLASGFVMFGFFAWVIKRFADLDYFMKILPFEKAIKLAWFDTELYSRND